MALFINDKGEALRPIFGAPMSYWTMLPDNTGYNMRRADQIILDVDTQRQHHGFNDMIARTEAVYEKWDGGVYSVNGKITQSVTKRQSLRLQYDGNVYRPVNHMWWFSDAVRYQYQSE